MMTSEVKNVRATDAAFSMATRSTCTRHWSPDSQVLSIVVPDMQAITWPTVACSPAWSKPRLLTLSHQVEMLCSAVLWNPSQASRPQ